MKKLCVMAMLLITIGSFASPIKAEAAGGCSNFYQLAAYFPYCEDQGCGFLWLNPQTHYQDSLWERVCVKANGDTFYDEEIRTEKLGCC